MEKKFLNKKNLKIIDDGNSTALIKNSDLIIQTRCTTSVEATINSIKSINFIPISGKHGFAKFVDKISYNAKSKEHVSKLIDQLIFSKKKIRKKKQICLMQEFYLKIKNHQVKKCL